MTAEWITEANLTKARALWDDGLSAKQIAVKIGRDCTKNAIIGMARRREWPDRPSPIIRTGAPKKRVPAAQKTSLVFPVHTRALQYDHVQLALLRSQWGKHLDPRDICADFNAAGPAKVTLGQIVALARRMGLNRPLSWKKELARQQGLSRVGKAAWAPKKSAFDSKGGPIVIPLREVYRRAAELNIPRSKWGDIDALNKAMRRQKPEHPGFIVGNHQPSRLAWS